MRPTFQTNPDQIRRQQEILTALGYYAGKLDGEWGPASIEAMQKFERDPAFRPCYPNRGMPIGIQPWPIGFVLDPEARVAGLLYHPALEKLKVKAQEVQLIVAEKKKAVPPTQSKEENQ